jgi:hypothetical protein
MGCDDLFQSHWQEIYDRALEKKTRRIAAWKLGRTPIQVAVLWFSTFLCILFDVARLLGCFIFGIAFYAWLIYFLWPRSSLGRWIAAGAEEIFGFVGSLF